MHKTGQLNKHIQANDIEVDADGNLIVVGHHYGKDPKCTPPADNPTGCRSIRGSMQKYDSEYNL